MTRLFALRRLALWILAAMFAQAAIAQSDPVAASPPAALPPTLAGGLAPAAERARIQAERARVDGRFEQAQAACYRKFAVADCQSDARLVRREALADLRRQEVSLKAAEARAKGAEQQSRIDSKSSTQAELEAASQRAAAQEKQQARLTSADEKAATRAAAAQNDGSNTGGGQTRADNKTKNPIQNDPVARAEVEAVNQKKYDEKQKQAKQKAAERRKRQATGLAAPV